MKRKTKRPPNRLLEIVWGDAWNGSAWVRQGADECKPLLVSTVGYLVKETKEGYIVAGAISEAGLACNDFFIPRGMVKSVGRLKR